MTKENFPFFDEKEIEVEKEMHFSGSKNWFYCPPEKMVSEIEELKEKLAIAPFYEMQINVHTDSDILQNQLNWVNSLSEAKETERISLGDLYYITKAENRAPVLNPEGGRGLKEMTDKPADTVYDPISGICIINAWDRFTSLESLALGMRAFKVSEKGLHGMHAALLSKEGEGFLLVGRAGAGKTTASLILAERGFDLISDDWVEVYKRDNGFYARTVIPTISISNNYFKEMQRKFGVCKSKEPPGFISYGKLITTIKMLNPQWSPDIETLIKKVILLDNESYINDINGLSLLNFQKFINPHIPFFNMPQGAPIRAIHLPTSDLNQGQSAIDDFHKRTTSFYEEFAQSDTHSIQRLENKSIPIEETIQKLESIFKKV